MPNGLWEIEYYPTNYRRWLPDLGRCHTGHGRLLLYMLYDWETKRWAESHLKLTVLASKLLWSDIFVGGRELPQNTIFQIWAFIQDFGQ